MLIFILIPLEIRNSLVPIIKYVFLPDNTIDCNKFGSTDSRNANANVGCFEFQGRTLFGDSLVCPASNPLSAGLDDPEKCQRRTLTGTEHRSH